MLCWSRETGSKNAAIGGKRLQAMSILILKYKYWNFFVSPKTYEKIILEIRKKKDLFKYIFWKVINILLSKYILK